jgi:hypothetical protein
VSLGAAGGGSVWKSLHCHLHGLPVVVFSMSSMTGLQSAPAVQARNGRGGHGGGREREKFFTAVTRTGTCTGTLPPLMGWECVPFGGRRHKYRHNTGTLPAQTGTNRHTLEKRPAHLPAQIDSSLCRHMCRHKPAQTGTNRHIPRSFPHP